MSATPTTGGVFKLFWMQDIILLTPGLVWTGDPGSRTIYTTIAVECREPTAFVLTYFGDADRIEDLEPTLYEDGGGQPELNDITNVTCRAIRKLKIEEEQKAAIYFFDDSFLTGRFGGFAVRKIEVQHVWPRQHKEDKKAQDIAAILDKTGSQMPCTSFFLKQIPAGKSIIRYKLRIRNFPSQLIGRSTVFKLPSFDLIRKEIESRIGSIVDKTQRRYLGDQIMSFTRLRPEEEGQYDAIIVPHHRIATTDFSDTPGNCRSTRVYSEPVTFFNPKPGEGKTVSAAVYTPKQRTFVIQATTYVDPDCEYWHTGKQFCEHPKVKDTQKPRALLDDDV